MRNAERPFDAVQMMREIRHRLSETFKGLSIEEEKRYIRERVTSKVRHQKARP